MDANNQLIKQYITKLNGRIEDLERYILMGPDSLENSDEVVMQYMRRVGELNEAKHLKELFEHTVKTYYE
jgi:hypothetical protein